MNKVLHNWPDADNPQPPADWLRLVQTGEIVLPEEIQKALEESRSDLVEQLLSELKSQEQNG